MGFSTLIALMNRLRGAIPNTQESEKFYFPPPRVMELIMFIISATPQSPPGCKEMI